MTPSFPLASVLESFETGKRPKGGAVETGIPSLGGEHVTAEGTIKLAPMKFIPFDFYQGMKKGLLRVGDVLVVKDGATTGRVGMIEPGFPYSDAAINEHLFLLRADAQRLDSQYLYFYLRSAQGQLEIMSDFRGAAQGGISREIGEKVRIPLPSLPEQHRLVDILSRAEGIVRLHREALAKTRELIPALFLDLFGDPATNPKGWPVKTLGELISDGPQNGLYKHASAYGDGAPIVRIDAFYDGRLSDLATLRRLSVTGEEIARYGLREGDILVNRVNSPEYLGKSAIVPELPEPVVFESNMMRLAVDGALIRPGYLIQHLQTGHIKTLILSKAKHAINQSSINQQDVKSFPVPIPPLHLQNAFFARVAEIESIQSQTTTALVAAEATFQSLLHRAFQTTPDANGRPAAVLTVNT